MKAILAIVVIAAAGAYLYLEQEKKSSLQQPAPLTHIVTESAENAHSKVVNKCTDTNGLVTFSDTPCQDNSDTEQITVTSAVHNEPQHKQPDAGSKTAKSASAQHTQRHGSPARAIEAAHNADASALY